MSTKKINPRNRPVSQADLKRAKADVFERAVKWAMVIVFTVLLDKFGFDKAQLKKLWRHVNDLSDSVDKGLVKLHELRTVLNKEYEIDI